MAMIAAEEGVSTATLYNWCKRAREEGRLLPDHDDSPEGWSSRDKFNAVLETAALSEAELSESNLCHDLYPEQVRRWREACAQANDYEASRNQKLRRAALAENLAAFDHSVVLHGDNGSPLQAGTVYATLHALGFSPSHSRPRVSNDNPHAEALFRTVKYHSSLPAHGFVDLGEARRWAASFVHAYNHLHRHSALRLVTPAQKHAGEDRAILARRKALYENARNHRPERWVRNTNRNWTPVTFTTLSPTDPKDLEPLLKKSA